LSSGGEVVPLANVTRRTILDGKCGTTYGTIHRRFCQQSLPQAAAE